MDESFKHSNCLGALPRQPGNGCKDTYSSVLRLVLVSRALPIATPACSPIVLPYKLQESKGTELMSHKYSNCLGPRPRQTQIGFQAPP